MKCVSSRGRYITQWMKLMFIYVRKFYVQSWTLRNVYDYTSEIFLNIPGGVILMFRALRRRHTQIYSPCVVNRGRLDVDVTKCVTIRGRYTVDVTS